MPDSNAGKESGPTDLTIEGMLDALRRAAKFYKNSFLALFRFFLLIQLALFAIFVGAALLTRNSDSRLTLVLVQIPLPLAEGLIGSYAFALASRFGAAEAAGQKETTIGSSLALRRVRRDLVMAGLYSSVLVIGLVLLFRPIAPFFIPMVLGPPLLAQVIAIESKKMPTALPRTRELGATEWPRILLYLLSIATGLLILEILVVVAVGLALGNLVVGWSSTSIGLVVGGLYRLLFAFAWPFIACLQVVLYLDIRSRKDDLDLARLSAELNHQS